LAIVVNESLPIGIVMSPSESSDLSTTFARFIDLLEIPNYTANPILSDNGSALQAYASRIGAEHFLCERNAAVKRHRILAFRLVRVCNCLKERFDRACGLPHRQANETLKRLNSYDSEKTLGCTRRCGRSKIYSMRFGLGGFTCKHMICPELSQMTSPEPDSPQIDDVPLEFTIEPLAFLGLAGGHDGTAIMPDGEDVELEDPRIMEVPTSGCTVLRRRKLPRNTLFVATAVD
jgi:hypothetical protein